MCARTSVAGPPTGCTCLVCLCSWQLRGRALPILVLNLMIGRLCALLLFPAASERARARFVAARAYKLAAGATSEIPRDSMRRRIATRIFTVVSSRRSINRWILRRRELYPRASPIRRRDTLDTVWNSARKIARNILGTHYATRRCIERILIKPLRIRRFYRTAADIIRYGYSLIAIGP